MKKRYLFIIAIILIIVFAVYLLNKGNKNDSILSSICNGNLEKMRYENPKEFLEIYNKTKTETSGVISGKCKSGEDITDCISRNEEILEKMNCMAKFLNQSDLSEKEIQELRELTGV